MGDYQPGDMLGGRYRVIEVLGRGSSGVTYKAQPLDADGSGGGPVAVKALSLRGLKGDWKALELFQREAKVLEALQHPGIPRYLEYFEEDTPSDQGFFLVQELAEGKSLADMVKDGWRGSEQDIKQITGQLLDILQYLGGRRPAVTHRDVKPENIILADGRADGRVFLVDFGGVQAAASGASGIGTTVVGTYGYMAPEQFRGAALPASDLYGLGGTLLFLLSGKPPSSFPERGLRLDYPSDLITDPNLDALVDGLLEPLTEDRLSASEALSLLRAAPDTARQERPRRGGGSRKDLAPGQPAGSRAILKRRGKTLELEIPPAGLTSDSLFTGAFAVAWNAFVAIWTVGALAGGGVLMALFSLPFWAAGFAVSRSAFGKALVRERLEIGAKRWNMQRQLALVKRGAAEWSEDSRKGSSGLTRDLSGARVVTLGYVNGVPQTQVELVEGVNKHVIGEGLDLVEQQWLVAQLNSFLEEARGSVIQIEVTEDRSQDNQSDAFDSWDSVGGSNSLGGSGFRNGRIGFSSSRRSRSLFNDDLFDSDSD